MDNETRAAVYDSELHLEAYRLRGIVQPFPNHFHDYYVLGLVESGQRMLVCRGRTYTLKAGDILLLNPGDSHACAQSDGGTLDYRGLNLPQQTMQALAQEITGRPGLPGFSQNALADPEAAGCLRALHRAVMERTPGFSREEDLLLLLSLLLQRYGQPFERCIPACRDEIERACAFMEQHYVRRISLEQLCRCSNLSRSALLRAFTKDKGVTPYSYLQNIRIGQAKKLLEQGVPPVEAALRTGFSDQSHFAHYFQRFIGLPPGAYRDIFLEQTNTEDPAHAE